MKRWLLLFSTFCTSTAYAQMTIMAGLYVPPEMHAQERKEATACEIEESRAKVHGADRYSALFIEAFCKGDESSYQERMLSKGLAVLMMPGMGEYPEHWRAAQRKAQLGKIGVWQTWQPLSPDALVESFVENEVYYLRGRVHKVAHRDFGSYVNFSEEWKEDTTLFIHKEHRKHFGKGGIDALVGKEVAVIGRFYDSYGPMVDVTHPSQIEVLE